MNECMQAMQAYLRHGKEGVGGVALLHEALQVMLHELHHHEHIIQLLAHNHLSHQMLMAQCTGTSTAPRSNQPIRQATPNAPKVAMALSVIKANMHCSRLPTRVQFPLSLTSEQKSNQAITHSCFDRTCMADSDQVETAKHGNRLRKVQNMVTGF